MIKIRKSFILLLILLTPLLFLYLNINNNKIRKDEGLYNKEIFAADQAYGKYVIENDPKLRRGYLVWARPIVFMMKKSETFTYIISIIATPWAKQMAYEMGATDKGSKVGKAMMLIGEPITRSIGVIDYGVDNLITKNIAGLFR